MAAGATAKRAPRNAWQEIGMNAAIAYGQRWISWERPTAAGVSSADG